MRRAACHAFPAPSGALAAALALPLFGGPVMASADLCALLLEVETEAADALAGHMPPAATVERRVEQIGALAATQTDLSLQLLSLSLAYRSAAAVGSPADFATVLRRAAGELRWMVPACDLPPMAAPVDGLVVTPRPPATAARDPQRPPVDPGPLAVPAPGRNAAERETPAASGRVPGTGRLVALVVPACVAAIWLHWRFFGRQAGARRHPCRVPARLRVRGLAGETRLEDISHRGARVRVQGIELEIGDIVEVSCAHFRRVGRVQWANASYAGLRFRRAISRAAIEACIGAARTQDAPDRRLAG